jgi:voltage-gated potassium channel
MVRVVRILWAFRSVKHLVGHIFKSKAKGTLTAVMIIAFLMIIFSSIAILQVEKDPESNIKTAEDAIWWAYATITTVGYGDKFPVTTEGRIIAGLLMTTGLGLCGTFAGFIATLLMAEKKENEEEQPINNPE